ncbi:hypothetical protein FRC00_013288 [Tulasnella sp. 408]|nr:hypothetical protein FRC00_013288 [Tulasnella sp. 408]
MLPEEAFHQLNHSNELVTWRRCIYKNELEAALRSLSLRRLTLRSVNAEKRFAQEPTHAGQFAIHSKSRIQTLDLNYPTKIPINFPQDLAPLVLMSSLETLLTSPKSFKGIGQFLATITYAILSRALTAEDLPANLPDLESYEGRQDYLAYFHAPSLRRALVKHFPWDGGALIDALASMSTDLESLVIELASKLDDPQWVEVAAGKWSPLWGDQPKFSLILRTAPLGEWIYSAQVGRNEVGELFIEYFSRREEAMGYLSDKVTVKAAK